MSKLFTFLEESDSSQPLTPGEGDCHQYVEKYLREQERSDRHDDVRTIGSTYSGIEDNRPGYGPVSNTDGRQTPAVVGKLYAGRRRFTVGR